MPAGIIGLLTRGCACPGFGCDVARDATCHDDLPDQTAEIWQENVDAERHTLDVIAEDLAMTLGSSLSKTLSSFAAARHCVVVFRWLE